MARTPVNRKTAPGVKGGRVQKKNNHASSPDIFKHRMPEVVVQRGRPRLGFYHPASVTDVKRFLKLIPDWPLISAGIDGIVLTEGSWNSFGAYYSAGVIYLHAWPKDWEWQFPEIDRWIFERFHLAADSSDSEIRLTPNQAKAFVLLATLLHEIGHHVDRIGTKSKSRPVNGEPFAETYEQRRRAELWDAYVKEFGDPNASR